MADRVVTRRRQVDAEGSTFCCEKLVWYLNEHSGAVAGQWVRTDGTAMGQIDKDLEAVLDDFVRFFGTQVRNKADAAGIMFMCWIVETLLIRCSARLARIDAFAHVFHR